MAKSFPCDADLWTKICKDDYRAFTVLFDRYWLILYKTANKYVKDPETCEEIVHDLFLTLWNRRKHIAIDNFNNYLKAATRYQVYAYLKKHRASPILYLDSYDEELALYQENSGHERMAYNDLENEMDSYLKQLPKRSSEVFALSRKQHLTNDEIAERLGISKRSVENQLTLALKHLRIHFKNIAIFLITVYSLLKH